ncbi:MAG TPA: erythromycin esterase family protein [Gemmatimonadaceae bacterium]|nr:erythromycin esterase family protein [Gemmatimonadaceae bacterium]
MPIFSRILVALPVVAIAMACHSAPPPAPPPPVTLSDSAAAAVRWVDAHAVGVPSADSVASAAEQHALMALAGDARVIGFSELTEGTHEFPYIVRRALFALADSANVRGLAIQAPMAETMELDRYVRTGVGDPRRLARTLGSWRWETVEMIALINAMRERNRTVAPDKQIGFYGFELPSAAHAVQVVTALPDSITGAALGAWLRREYGCVAANEGAHWGLEGRLADSTFWQRCGPVATAAVDSIVALRHRVGTTSHATELAYAEQMARLIQHHVTIGLRRLPRQDAVAEHVLFLASLLGPDAKLVTWGGDVEAGRLTLGGTTVQSGMSLGTKLGARYRPIAFVFADGSVRAQRPSSGRTAGGGGAGGGLSGLRDVRISPSASDEFEDVFRRATGDAYWLDVRPIVGAGGNTWLRGPHQARLITEVYAPQAPELFLTPMELPKFFDVVLFVRHVTPAHP